MSYNKKLKEKYEQIHIIRTNSFQLKCYGIRDQTIRGK